MRIVAFPKLAAARLCLQFWVKLDIRYRGVAQSGSAPGLGPGCREFESLHPDHFLCLNYCLADGKI
jgi:hypothetical protein